MGTSVTLTTTTNGNITFADNITGASSSLALVGGGNTGNQFNLLGDTLTLAALSITGSSSGWRCEPTDTSNQ